MNKASMFELEKAISEWRKRMEAAPALEPGQIAEVESHLRDKVDDLTARGRTHEQAFEEAVRALGETGLIGSQFFKATTPRRSGRPSWQAPRFVPALAWNYFRTASRAFRRNRAFSLINVAGLALGMLTFLLIMTWVRHQLSYDRFHENLDELFMILSRDDKGVTWNTTTYALPPALKEEYAEVEDFARVWPWQGSLVKYGDVRFEEDAITLTDPGFFRMFSFPFVRGNAETALPDKNSIVLTESTARRYFGDEDPLGKVLHLDQLEQDFKVTGVVRDVPANSSIRFDMVTRVEWLGEERLARWAEFVAYAYVRLKPGVSAEAFNPKIDGIFQERVRPDWPPKPFLQPFAESYLYWDGRPGVIVRVVIFSAVAALVLLLACVNFMNLSVVQSIQRAREVGMRKAVGATRGQVARQFLGETLFLSFLSMGLALAAAPAVLPAFGRLAGTSLTLFGPGPEGLIGLLALAAALTGLLAGSYPAFLLSTFRPVETLRNRAAAPPGGARLRKALTVFQFAASVVILVGAIVVSRQLRFIKSFDLGLDREQVVSLSNNLQIQGRMEAFKQDLGGRPGILGVTYAGQRPLDVGQTIGVNWEGNPAPIPARIGYMMADYDFFEVFGMDIVRGRSFSPAFNDAEADTCVVNEAAARMFGWEDPIGRTIVWSQAAIPAPRRNVRIVGVVKDFYDRSLRSGIRPFMLRVWRPWNNFIFVKVDKDRMPQALAGIKEAFQKFAPEYTFDYEFLDDYFERQYAVESQQGRLFNVFGALSLVIAALGLFGLAAYTAARRTKEIGIRKVMGASVPKLVVHLTRDYLALVGAALLIAWPAGYYVMSKWLGGFVRRTPLSPAYFVLAAAAMLLVVAVAVGSRTLRAARANPADCLRYE
jgi:putative ABC transport system permease protein